MSEGTWSGNIGEWGEAYALLWLLAYKRVFNADSHGNKISDEYSDVQQILRREVDDKRITFTINGEYVEVFHDDQFVGQVPRNKFRQAAEHLYQELLHMPKATATFSEGEFLKSLGCESLKASSQMKADLIAIVLDGQIGARARRNYSIKTVIGGKPSLANASHVSYVDYILGDDFDEEKAEEVNSIPKKGACIVKKTKKVLELCNGHAPVPHIRNATFRRNLMRAYYRAPEVVGLALFYGQMHSGKPVIESIADLKKYDPLHLTKEDWDDYDLGIRRYLWAVTLGLTPSNNWRVEETADGYLLVNNNGQVYSYQTSRQRDFENYLLLHSKWDTPSLGRYADIGKVQRDKNGIWIYTLNVCVRYDLKEYEASPEALKAAGIEE